MPKIYIRVFTEQDTGVFIIGTLNLIQSGELYLSTITSKKVLPPLSKVDSEAVQRA